VRNTQLPALFAFLAAGVLPTSATAQAEPEYVVQSNVSGGTLAQLCKVERDLQLDSCNSYILGAADGLAMGGEICPPVESWTLIAPRVVKKYIKDNPTALSAGGAGVVFMALSAAYPCRPKRR
jgi:hypothetical protein